MESKSKEDAFPPQCLNLRVHSSILLDSSSENEILLPRGIVFRKTRSNRKLEGNDNNVHDGRVFTVEENAGTIHAYMSVDNEVPAQANEAKNEIDNKTISSRFDILTSSSQERILIQSSMIDGIDELGRRARARSEQQRLNRKGIKMIEGTSLIIEQEQQKQARLRATISSKPNGGTKRQRTRNKNEIQQSSKISRKSNPSLWSPDISKIPMPHKENQSVYVQLHGLPIGSTFETVRRFFTGLDPERILVVLTNRAHVSELDAASYDDLSSFGLEGIIYTNMDVRVLVKFGSVSEAGLAADRSGETIASKHIHAQNSLQQDSFVIGVTKISKAIALLLSKLSFDALPGVPFHACLLDVEAKLRPKVREILWASAEKVCRINLEGKTKTANILINSKDNEAKPLTFADYKRHSIHHNDLLGIHDDLAASIIQNDAIDMEDSVPVDAVTSLTSNACTVIDLELDRIDGLLHQYRISKLTHLKN